MTYERELYENRADTNPEKELTLDCTGFECCHEELVFALRDKHHEFSLGLSTILECLAAAERTGNVPKLPDMWWLQIRQY